MKEELEREFQELQKFVFFLGEYFYKWTPKQPDNTPSTSADKPKEKVTRSQWLVGFRQAANDFAELATEISPSELARADAELRSRGIVTLSEMVRRRSRVYKRIVKRGRIKDDTEFYIIKAVLDDLESGASDVEREQLGKLISQYESKLRSPS